ncbi:hypothetical protein ACWEQL_24255 [Kitasatospora sp. NPDC004240]
MVVCLLFGGTGGPVEEPVSVDVQRLAGEAGRALVRFTFCKRVEVLREAVDRPGRI